MQRLLELLKPLQSVATKVNIRLAIVAVVLGVGGFAVYKGVQQLSPKNPTPKKVVNNSKQGENPALPEATEVSGGDPSLNPLVGQTQYQTGAESAPLYGGTGGNIYSSGANDEPTTNSTTENGMSDRGAELAAGGGGAIPRSSFGKSSPAVIEQPMEEVTEGQGGSDSLNTLRSGGPENGYSVGDDSEGPAAESSGGQPGVYGSQPAEDSGAVVEEVPTEPTVNPAPSRFPRSRAAAPQVEEAEEPAEPRPLRSNIRPLGPAADNLEPTRRSFGTPAGRGTFAGEQGIPGERQLEGMQAPSVALEKLAPAEVQVGKLATFETRVRNVGQVAAHDVIVTDHVPKGTRLEATTPQATQAADGTLTWNLGAMQPGDEIAISMQVTPEMEGEIGSVAQVGFAGKATARTISTRPLLTIEHTAPKQVMIGETVRLQVTITNPGSGAATGVLVEEDVPDGLSHVAGNELEYEIGVLRPGESRQLELSLKADKPGVVENTIVVRGEGNLNSQHQVQIEVISPQLQVGVNGPKKRYLDRQANYTLTVANPGTAAARDVQLVAYLPKGMKFVNSDSEGQYDPAQHAVFWSLEELPAAKSGNVKLTTIPFETGEQRIRVEGKAELGLNVASEQVVQVDAASELVFTISDLSDPIEVGTDTIYEIRVTNNGSRPATNVRLAAALPSEIKLVSGEGPSRAAAKGQQIGFEPVKRINPGEEAIFRIYAQGIRAGDHLINVQLSSDEFPNPVTKQESTQVYVDR